MPDIIVISPQVWATLSAEHRDVLRRAAADSVAFQRELWARIEQENLAAVQSAGVEIIRPDKEPFIEAVQPLWQRFEGTEVGELARQIREMES